MFVATAMALDFRVYNSQTVQFSTTLAFKPSQGLFSTTSKMRGSGKTFPTGAFIIGCMHPLSSEQSHLKGKTKCFLAFRSHIQSAAHFKKAIPMHVAPWICSITFNHLSLFFYNYYNFYLFYLFFTNLFTRILHPFLFLSFS